MNLVVDAGEGDKSIWSITVTTRERNVFSCDVSLYSAEWSRNHYVDQAKKPQDLPASSSQVLVLKAWTTTPNPKGNIYIQYFTIFKLEIFVFY